MLCYTTARQSSSEQQNKEYFYRLIQLLRYYLFM